MIMALIVLLLLPIWGCRSFPEKKERKETTTPEKKISAVNENTDIHYTGRYCSECHEKKPVKGGNPYLKYNGNYRILCRCHHGMSPGYCHPLDINSKLDRKLPIPAGFPLTNGKFTCNTCHDVYRQCQKRLFDRQSLRGAPYERRTDFCYRCHDKKKYQKLNPHHQISSDGRLKVEMCLYCHAKKPDQKTATYKDVTFIGNTRALCRRCHDIKGDHPGNFNHMAARPSAEALQRMAAMKKKFHIILPLAADGKMTCVTCHNPHEKGVIAANKPSAKGAGSKYRLRLPGKMCIECHQM